jgi:hypothetical protein
MTVSLPVSLTGSYLTKQPDAGIPAGPSVFDALANPPASGTAAETAQRAKAIAKGVNEADSVARTGVNKHQDRIRDELDTASILSSD